MSNAKKRISIVTIATGSYFDLFFHDFQTSVIKLFSEKFTTRIYCFTDHEGRVADEVVLIKTHHLGWPFDTLFRFHLIERIIDQLIDSDFILFMDADMEAKACPDEKIINADLVAVQHPGYFRAPHRATYEVDDQESSFIPAKNRKHYVQGCFWGGKPLPFRQLITTIREKIDQDLALNMIPIWHDESYLNWYLSKKQFLPLSPAYAFPEGAKKLAMTPVVVHRAKNHDKARKIRSPAIAAEQILAGVTIEDKLALFQQLYHKSHEKNQRLEHKIALFEAKFRPLLRLLKGFV